MERLTKIAFYVGIGIAVSLFALFMVSALPGIIGSAANQWDGLGDTGKSEAELLARFQGHPAYAAMYERFPDAVEEVTYIGNGRGSMDVGAMNFENNSQLVLHMYIFGNDVRVDVTCMNDAKDGQTHVDDLFTENFIRNTDCLDTVHSGRTSGETPGQTVCRASGPTITCSAPP